METFKHVISMGRDKIMSGIKYVYSDINPSTLTGAIDVIVVEQRDGTFTCGPFHVRFGKMGTLKPADKIVDIHLNDVFLEHLHMKLGSAGEAYFIETVEESLSETLDSSLVVSPFHSDTENNDDNDISDISSSRLSKKRSRRNVRLKSDYFVKNNLEEASAVDEKTLKNQYPYLSDNDDFAQEDSAEFVREGYNSDGAVDKITKEEMNDINMTWDWGNFPLDIRTANERPSVDSDNTSLNMPVENISDVDQTMKEIYLEDILNTDISDDLKRTYLYTDQSKTNSRFAGNENATINVDAGYRSDGEGMSPTAMSPTYPIINELKLSLCGDINVNDKISEETFFQYLISFEDFIKDPDEVLKNSNLVLLLNGKYYNWAVAAPIILSIIGFQSELPSATITNLKTTYMSQKKRRSTWFSWRRQDPSPDRNKMTPEPSATATVTKTVSKSDMIDPKSKIMEATSLENVEDSLVRTEETGTVTGGNSKLYKKKIRLSSSEVASLNLKEGRNDIMFSMTTKYQGTTCCHATIYRWKWFDKIVISDVDGTITKSDVLGHVLPILGRDWTQAGVVKLYNKINQNNYRFIYLSARAIGQANITRTFLKDIVRESTDKLPEGPILLSPTSLFQSLHREVIEKKPEYFKIQCLKDVRALFPASVNPLYAGFGNRVNDVIAYKEVGVDPKRIFTVNPEGSLKNEYCQKWSTSYGNLFDVADHFFQFQPTSYEKYGIDYALEDYIDVNYWASPIDEQEIREEINKSKSVK